MARAAFIILVFLCWSSVVHAEKRVALLIGNSAYEKASKLLNPANDAKAIAGMLRAANFDEVVLYENLGIRELRRAVKDFSDRARDADTAVLYYSGHGIEVNGTNYLVPTDAVLDRDIDVPFEAYSLDNLVQVLEPARQLRLVMLDACRENPFSRSMKRTIGSRALGRGLAPVEPTSVNTLIGFAAKAGSIALDGDGPNSPYATALLNHITTPGLDLRIAFGRVRDEVLKVTRNKQEPFVYGSLGGMSISLVPAPPAPRPFLPEDMRAEYELVERINTEAAWELFVNTHKRGYYVDLARERLRLLQDAKRKKEDEEAAKSEAEARAKAQRQEEERIAAEKREAQEHARREAEAKRQAAAEAARKAEEEALAKRQQEDRIAAEKREAEERARREAEAKRQAAAEAARKKVEEEARVKAAEQQKIASLPQGPKVELPEQPVNDPPAQRLKHTEELSTTKAAEEQRVAVSLPKIDMPKGAHLFDGSWTIIWQVGAGCKAGSGSYSIRIHGNAISGGSAGGSVRSGSVNPTGAVRWTYLMHPAAVPGRVKGTLRGNSGSGRWANSGSGCTGTFTARRN